MTDATLPTEPLRAEHHDLLPHLRGLETIADEVDRWNADEAAHVLDEIVGFLRGHLVPHARAEEQVLYPAVEQAMAAPGATATRRADHTEIVSRIDRLADTAATVADRWPDNAVARDLTHQLIGLSAILLLHFRKEEDVLLPVLDTPLGPDDADALFTQMAKVAHG